MSLVLGINAYHADAAACVVRDGVLVAAAEEERFRRVKHCAGFPTEAIAFCLREAGAELGDVDNVGINKAGRANWIRKLASVAAGGVPWATLADRLRHARRRSSLAATLRRAFPGARLRARVHEVEHHLAHLACGFHSSGFPAAAAVSVDGFGDFASAAWGAGDGAGLRVERRVYFPHSLGIFYEAITRYLGFPRYGDEYKVMGLAAHGGPGAVEAVSRLVEPLDDGGFRLDLRYFRHHREGVDYEWQGGEPSTGRLHAAALEELLGPARDPAGDIEPRHRDIAFAAQRVYEEALFNLLGAVQRRSGADALCLTGGCAMNSVANGKIPERTRFRRLYVHPAAGDAGGALGAAMHVAAALGEEPRPVAHAFWGPAFADAEVAALLDAEAGRLEAAGCEVEAVGDERLFAETARAIARGEIVAWFQGRMEWGPRALGNRSILGDPRRRDMQDVLNRKIKRREPFRPFAPAVPREAMREWFERDEDVPCMTSVLAVRPEHRDRIPAVVHVDGTGRVQTVEAAHNERFWRLLRAFEEESGIPVLLNTSFNENEPIVCSPREALDCFLRTRMDRLVIGNRVVRRRD